MTQENQRPPADATTAARRIKLLKFVVDFGCGRTERQFVNLSRALDGNASGRRYSRRL